MDAVIFGLIVADLIGEPIDLRHPPAPGGLVPIRSIQVTTGGNACNVALAMAKLGMQVSAAGLVGDDLLGRAVVERLQSGRVDTKCISVSNAGQTSATVVAVEPGGERCFFHAPGATTHIDGALFRGYFPAFARCRFLQVGYFGLLPALTPELPGLLAELRTLAPETKIALDTVNPPGKWEQLQPILPFLDIFAPSRPEATALTGETDPVRMVAAFRRQMPRGLIGIKLDAEGCYLDDVRSTVRIPAAKVQVVDTTGAGDAWFGGLLTALCREMPLEQAGRFASRVAADCCTALGASAGIQSMADTLARMNEPVC